MITAYSSNQIANPLKCLCGGKVVRDMESGENVCTRCGVIGYSNSSILVAAESLGRAPTSHGVVGNDLGTMHTLKDSNGKNFLYEARSKKGVFPYYDPDTKQVVAGASIMPGHISGFEEPDKTKARAQQNISRICLNGHIEEHLQEFKPRRTNLSREIVAGSSINCLGCFSALDYNETKDVFHCPSCGKEFMKTQSKRKANEFKIEEIAVAMLNERAEAQKGVGTLREKPKDELILRECDPAKYLRSLIKSMYNESQWRLTV